MADLATAQPGRVSWSTGFCVALFLAVACVWGVLEVHSSTDTWIGLAAGKQIVEEVSAGRPFPTRDTFSYTRNQTLWYNQNWLTHVAQFVVYQRLGPDALIWGNWLLCLAMFGLVLLACYWRTGSWIGSALAAAVVAIGCRDYVSARAATVGFVCLATLWALVSALEGQSPQRRRWWPIVLLLPLLVFWGMAHGSFIFAYGMLGLYLAHWLVFRLVRPQWLALSAAQFGGIVAVCLAALVLTVVLGPFGLDNFLHPGKIAGSARFREVSEWRAPIFLTGPGGRLHPPVYSFWIILAGSVFALLAALQIRMTRATPGAASQSAALRWTWYDVGAALLALAMTLTARRFAPLFYVFAAPLLLIVFLNVHRALREDIRAAVRTYAPWALLGGALALGGLTYVKAYQELIADVKQPNLSLFGRVTRGDLDSQQAFDYLRENEVSVNLLVEWSQAGNVMFHAPKAKVFIDGRAQQVYEERDYEFFLALLVNTNPPEGWYDRALEVNPRPDAVLLRRTILSKPLWEYLEASPKWAIVMMDTQSALFVRRESPALRDLGARLRAGREWRPVAPEALATRGNLWVLTSPPNPQAALECWQQAIDQRLTLAAAYARNVATAYHLQGRHADGVEYFTALRSRLAADAQIRDDQRTLPSVDRALQSLRAVLTPAPTSSRPTP